MIFPAGTKLAGPVAVLNRQGVNLYVLIAWKVIFPDCEVVLAAPTRLLWQGVDGQGFDTVPGANWQIMSVKQNSGVILL